MLPMRDAGANDTVGAACRMQHLLDDRTGLIHVYFLFFAEGTLYVSGQRHRWCAAVILFTLLGKRVCYLCVACVSVRACIGHVA